MSKCGSSSAVIKTQWLNVKFTCVDTVWRRRFVTLVFRLPSPLLHTQQCLNIYRAGHNWPTASELLVLWVQKVVKLLLLNCWYDEPASCLNRVKHTAARLSAAAQLPNQMHDVTKETWEIRANILPRWTSRMTSSFKSHKNCLPLSVSLKTFSFPFLVQQFINHF